VPAGLLHTGKSYDDFADVTRLHCPSRLPFLTHSRHFDAQIELDYPSILPEVRHRGRG
jgi:hypothetical protein